MQVDHTEHGLKVGLLQRDKLLHGTQIIAQMQAAGRLNAREDAAGVRDFGHGIQSKAVLKPGLLIAPPSVRVNKGPAKGRRCTILTTMLRRLTPCPQ